MQLIAASHRHAKKVEHFGGKLRTHMQGQWHVWLFAIACVALAGALASVLYAAKAQRSAPQDNPPYWTKHLTLQAATAPKIPSTIELASTQPLYPKPVSNPLSLTMIVNKKFQLDAAFVPPDLSRVNVPKTADDPLRSEAARALEQLFASATQAGVSLTMNSGYRSYSAQQALYNQEIASRGKAGADEFSARPGFSEHQSGLAADVAQGSGPSSMSASTWVAAHAHEFGFIVRYQTGKEAITGYHAEPWHIRYVGTALAAKLFASGQTMEEHFAIPGGDYAN
ncbi:MAG TPA: M15 family metallopeptidase [Candidatus Saccharimonadales bacterium]|nr:M15 family metallopeptidase [Candidatus Saccharimonadales bacterium]